MASWGEIEREAPELAREARTLLEAHVHKTIATLRADGSPRDPRFSLHSGSDDPPDWWTEAGGLREVTRR